jgi:site-specific DNA-methyltransferase (adenine-specific)
MKEMDASSIDLTITSPPYDQLRSYAKDIDKTWGELIWKPCIEQIYRITKTGGTVVWVVGDSTKNGCESGTSFMQALYAKEVGWNLHDTMIYRKINYVPLTHNRYEQCFEYMFVWSKGKPKTFNPLKMPCKYAGKMEKYGKERRKLLDMSQSMRVEDRTYYRETGQEKILPNIWEYSVGQVKNGHPAVFPEKLVEDHILSWSNENDTIFDPFMGSGTTGKMALLNNRNFIGVEINESYLKITEDRLNSVLISSARNPQ